MKIKKKGQYEVCSQCGVKKRLKETIRILKVNENLPVLCEDCLRKIPFKKKK